MQGMERIDLTANRSVFEQQKGEAREIILKAQQEWIEFEEATGKGKRDKEGRTGPK